ncbi:MAG: hypothetical protein HYX90_10420 [Chloroflexi bacterium]|nr:hypothetical protein [Chloroflexota bacterium]
MKYYNLKSIITAGKSPFNMKTPLESFYLAQTRERPYIEPTFAKVIFDSEKPAVILISAVGATGKSTLAEVLSNQTGLPLLDLGKHKPVGADALTGLLTSAFDVDDLSNIFKGIAEESYGIIIDGVDEGRAKTTQAAFEAFLDDIVRLCPRPTKTSIVLLGRTQTVDDCWDYLSSRGMAPALITISPFDLRQARQYIDSFTDARQPQYEVQYQEARDIILTKLGSAFTVKADDTGENFLSFIGYPPVLDAIVTLLKQEKNYHKLLKDIGAGSTGVETSLLHRIALYILTREKEQKVVPNILDQLGALPPQISEDIRRSAFGFEEQCMRLVSFCINRPLSLQRISEPSINEKYEKVLATCPREHPFIHGRQFRNAVFESVALVTLMTSGNPECAGLVQEYVGTHKHSYHLVYLLSAIAPQGYVPIYYLDILLDSALEFRSRTSSVELHVEGPETDAPLADTKGETAVDIDIEILLGKNKEQMQTFSFNSKLANTTQVNLGWRLSATYVSLPCDVVFSGNQELDFTAPVDITANKIVLQAKALMLRCDPMDESRNYVLLQAASAQSTVESIITNGVTLALAVSDRSGLAYPAIQYVQTKEQLPPDPELGQKYLRLRRILSELRAHGRGSLARVKDKIEDDRVLKGKIGQAVLKQLLSDKILVRSGEFYHLDPKEFDKHLGISWPALRMHRMSEQLERYLRSIP